MSIGEFHNIKYTAGETLAPFSNSRIYGGTFKRTDSNYWSVTLEDPEGVPVYGTYRNGRWSWEPLALKSDVTPVQFNLTNVHSAVTDISRLRSYKVGQFVVINGYFTINASLANGTTLFRSPYKPLWLQVGHLDRSGYEGKYFPIYCINTTGDVTTNCGTLSANTYDINMIFVCQ
jgi:hypothetical protein